eukprot:jgi/Psemu1/18464/gm1.18464_g
MMKTQDMKSKAPVAKAGQVKVKRAGEVKGSTVYNVKFGHLCKEKVLNMMHGVSSYFHANHQFEDMDFCTTQLNIYISKCASMCPFGYYEQESVSTWNASFSRSSNDNLYKPLQDIHSIGYEDVFDLLQDRLKCHDELSWIPVPDTFFSKLKCLEKPKKELNQLFNDGAGNLFRVIHSPKHEHKFNLEKGNFDEDRFDYKTV